MYSTVNTATVFGIDSHLISVEADISDGMPIFEMVGYLSSEVKEAKERVRAALKNEGYSLPVKRITVNLSPVNIRKTGSGFDLPVAVAILAALGFIDGDKLKNVCIFGEISLDGKIQPITGVLPMVLEARNKNMSVCILPVENIPEARLVPDIVSIGVNRLHDVIELFENDDFSIVESQENAVEKVEDDYIYDFSMINGQEELRRACEVAISGMHNMLMIGPPGAGKSMIAKCIPSILPPMSPDEQIELSKIYSVCGKFDERSGLMKNRPFRSPHHTVSSQGLTGGGTNPKPGEISLAHGGVLFLDELTEFNKSTLEILRQPMEDKKVNIARVSGSYSFPANFVLVAAMNPCNCGYFPNLNKCHCTKAQIQRYIGKISQPLLDRIDIAVEASEINYEELTRKSSNEPSSDIRDRVCKCHEIQRERFKDYSFKHNSEIPSNLMELFCPLDEEEAAFMKDMYEINGLTARTYHKVLRVARTIADMDGSPGIKQKHLEEALAYKGLDKKYWEDGI